MERKTVLFTRLQKENMNKKESVLPPTISLFLFFFFTFFAAER